jgi:hypothetical protein
MGPLRWVFTAVLLALAIINWAAGHGYIELNSTIGIRIPPLQRSESAWRAGHAAGVVPAAVAFTVSLICSIVGLFAGVAVWGVVVAFVGGLVWSITVAVRAANAA